MIFLDRSISTWGNLTYTLLWVCECSTPFIQKQKNALVWTQIITWHAKLHVPFATYLRLENNWIKGQKQTSCDYEKWQFSLSVVTRFPWNMVSLFIVRHVGVIWLYFLTGHLYHDVSCCDRGENEREREKK